MADAAPSAPRPIGVFLLDDHEIVRRGLCDLIAAEEDLTIVGEAGSVAEALRRIEACAPQVAVLDVQLADGSGIEVCREIRSAHPQIACLMLTSFTDDEALVESVVAGAAGYVLKQVRGNDLIANIRRVAAGETLIAPDLSSRVLDRLRRGPETDDRLASLTPRESSILALLADGLTNRQIGAELGLAEKTVKNNVSNLLVKMGMQRRTQAAVYAARHADRACSPH